MKQNQPAFDVISFLYEHILADWEALCKILRISEENAAMMLHLIIEAISLFVYL